MDARGDWWERSEAMAWARSLGYSWFDDCGDMGEAEYERRVLELLDAYERWCERTVDE